MLSQAAQMKRPPSHHQRTPSLPPVATTSEYPLRNGWDDPHLKLPNTFSGAINCDPAPEPVSLSLSVQLTGRNRLAKSDLISLECTGYSGSNAAQFQLPGVESHCERFENDENYPLMGGSLVIPGNEITLALSKHLCDFDNGNKDSPRSFAQPPLGI